MSYRDMTFCQSDCTNARCPRHLYHARDAKGLPVAMSDLSPDCPAYSTEGEGRSVDAIRIPRQ